MDVSVIIVNYNTFDLTRACIQSIYAQTTKVAFEIILVDNASSECDSNEFLKIFPEVNLIQNQINKGFGIANNQAMAIAQGRYFLLINSDTYFLNDVIYLAFEYAELNRNKYAVFGADVRNEDLSPQTGFYPHTSLSVKRAFIQGAFFENILFSKIYSKIAVDRNAVPTREMIGGLYGFYIFIDRTVYEDLGGFDPDFFMYCEDTEWFRNRIGRKYKIGICWEAKLVHLGGKSSSARTMVKENVLSYFLYWYKTGYFQYWVYVLFSYMNTLPNLITLPFMRKFERERHWRNITYRFLCLRKVFFDIPRFSNRCGSRKGPLHFKKSNKGVQSRTSSNAKKDMCE